MPGAGRSACGAAEPATQPLYPPVSFIPAREAAPVAQRFGGALRRALPVLFVVDGRQDLSHERTICGSRAAFGLHTGKVLEFGGDQFPQSGPV